MDLIKKALKSFSLDSVVYKYIEENPDKYFTLKDSDIKALQNCLLGMLVDFDKFCEENGLRYALTAGNVLGMIRHNGFIPWDDDLDVLMPRKDYDKLKGLFAQSSLAKQYTLKGPACPEGADYRCMKIYKKGTVMRPVLSKKNAVNEVFIDIMPIDYVPDNKAARELISLHSNLLIAILGCCEFKQNTNNRLKEEMKKTGLGKLNYMVRSVVGSIFSIVPIQTWYDHFDRAAALKGETNNVTVVNGKLLYKGEIVPADYFMPFHRCVFEGVNTYVINKPEAYLRHRYGKYEVIPDVKDRESHCVEELKI